MKKLIIVALLGISTLVHANTCSVFSGFNGNNNSANYSLQSCFSTGGSQVSGCTFTFTTCNTSSSGLLYCNLFGGTSTCSIGSQNGSTTTWTCTLDSNGLNCLNSGLNSGSCNLNLNCTGNWSIGSCSCNYTCTPTPPQAAPDTAMTFWLLGLGLMVVEVSRRRMVAARVQSK
jgi:hypothetical protein